MDGGLVTSTFTLRDTSMTNDASKQRKMMVDSLTSSEGSKNIVAPHSKLLRARTIDTFRTADLVLAGKTEVRSEEIEEHRIRFHHITDQGKAVFDLMDESNGTRNLMFLAGPVLDILGKGLTLVIDELDTSLHTLLVRELVRLFHCPEINTGGAQLIFTTHDTSLLDAPDLFRRDQVWFVEKDQDQASTLVSLSEFSPRKNEALERGYLMGRYGGVPFLSHTLGLKH